ncbi:dnaj-like protein subfamily c member 5b [Moniliophthora roreri MCA 2997]|uniref:Dnaj-like protein subfamily c member 5b n=1 Tax=Moniliophthora roreri (strain MCA 2997) TaxID=1381753 RepID=V2XPY5_MONRO|nr:dnaj-like protein subfamily c member 5b [Moniliophthora roreri MCA 2997]
MPITLAAIREAYAVLGLQEGASLEVVKSTYKQLALRTHPDKDPNNPNATAQFQKLGEAYNVLSKHLDTSQHSHHYEYDSDEYYDSDDDFSEEDEEFAAERDAYFRSLFEHIFYRAFTSYSHARFRREYVRSRRQEESNEEFQERVRQNREEQDRAEQRRKREAQIRKARAEEDREKERIAAEKRQRAKKEAKQAQAESERQKAETAARKQREKTQATRSAVFAAARKGDASRVKKGVWEEDVDAAGGEIKPGYEEFVKLKPKDQRETLLHIASSRGDRDLVEWLDAHNADIEERDSQGHTSFHTAVHHGQIPVMNYFFENHSHKDPDTQAIYTTRSSKSTLTLAVESRVPEVVQIVLDEGLCSTQEANDTWSWMVSADGRQALVNKAGQSSSDTLKAYDCIMALLMQHGGFTPPSTPRVSCSNKDQSRRSSDNQIDRDEVFSDSRPSGASSSSSHRGRGQGRGGGRGRGRDRGHGRGNPHIRPDS